MIKNSKRFLSVIFASLILSFGTYANESAQNAFAEGCIAYASGDWDSAVLLLKQSVGYSENVNPDTFYMLISSEMNAGENEEALDYCDFYLNNFGGSIYSSRVKYLKGKTLYNLGEYERSIIELSDFCHQYESDDMYANALFYIGESLYAGYKYDEACSIYERILVDFPDSDKAVASQYRIDSIAQRSREEKLLYLLKQTGEEYLSAKEDYEKQIRMYNSESVFSARQRLLDAQQKNEDLEKQIVDLEKQIEALNQEIANSEQQRIILMNQANDAAQEDYVTEIEQPESGLDQDTLKRLQMLKLKALEAQKRYEEVNGY